MSGVQELQSEYPRQQAAEPAAVQAGAYLLELSPDWIVTRASENIHKLLGHSHVTLIEEPLGRFVHSQALHDLRNLFSRLSGTTGIARAYGIRLTDDPELVDVAFQLTNGRVLLEAVPSTGAFGECFGTVGGLISGLASASGDALLDNGARRMRALTGYDRISLFHGDRRAESSRNSFEGHAAADDDVPAIVADSELGSVALFPREPGHDSGPGPLMAACSAGLRERLKQQGVRASLRVPFSANGVAGEFRCESRTAREPCLELHAAAELFAQLFAMQLEIDRLKSR